MFSSSLWLPSTRLDDDDEDDGDEDDGDGSPDNTLLFTGHSPRSGWAASKILSVQSLCLQNCSVIEKIANMALRDRSWNHLGSSTHLSAHRLCGLKQAVQLCRSLL